MKIEPPGELRQRQPRERDERHLQFIRRLPCAVRGCQAGPIHAAHIRAGSRHYRKRPTGLAEKPSDCWTVPLCARHHLVDQHAENELEWWRRQRVDPFELAEKLYIISGDIESGRLIVTGRMADGLPF